MGERPESLVIDHIDRNKLNNNVNNLRYVTQMENCRNHGRYRDDLEEKDPKLKKRIFTNEHAIKSGKNRNINRKKGRGQIYLRESGNWRAIITINKVKYSKTVKSENEAETFINNLSP